MSGALLDYGSISVLQNLLDKERRKPESLESLNRVTQGPADRTIFMVRPNAGATASTLMLGKMIVGVPGSWTDLGDIAVRSLDNATNLVPGKEYPGTFGGYVTISGTEYAVYDVSVSGGSSPWTDGTFLFLRYSGGGYDTYTSSGATTFDAISPNGSGGYTTGTAAVKNKDSGPLFHAATNLARTTWSPVNIPANSGTMIGMRATSVSTVDYYVCNPFFYPARFRRAAKMTLGGDTWRDVEFGLRAPGTLNNPSAWYLLGRDAGNYGSVGRMNVYEYLQGTLYNNGSYFLKNDKYFGAIFDMGGESSKWGLNSTATQTIDGTVGYTPDAGWFVAEVAIGAKPYNDGPSNMRGSYLIYNQQIINNLFGAPII